MHHLSSSTICALDLLPAAAFGDAKDLQSDNSAGGGAQLAMLFKLPRLRQGCQVTTMRAHHLACHGCQIESSKLPEWKYSTCTKRS